MGAVAMSDSSSAHRRIKLYGPSSRAPGSTAAEAVAGISSAARHAGARVADLWPTAPWRSPRNRPAPPTPHRLPDRRCILRPGRLKTQAVINRSSRHAASGWRDRPDYRVIRELGPGRHGGRLPCPEPAHGPRRGAQGDGSADHREARCAYRFLREIAVAVAPPEHRHAHTRCLRLADSIVLPWNSSTVMTFPNW